MRIEPLHPAFAAEVHDVRLWEPLGAETAQALRDALGRSGVLVFRRQSLSEDELVEVARLFGEPRVYVEKSWHSSRPEVSSVSNMRNGAGEAIGGLSSRELNWHTDQSYNARPVTGCFLYAQVVPNQGSRTCWASLTGAYDRLCEAARERARSANGVFSYAARTTSVIPGGDAEVLQQSYAERIRATPDVEHALVHRNPHTGARSIYIDPGTLVRVSGLDEADSRTLLDELEACATAPDNVYEHAWQVGDLVVWDNAVTLHRRDAFEDRECRLLKRMIFDLPADRHVRPGLEQT